MYPLQKFFHKILLAIFSLVISVVVLMCFAYLFLDSQLPNVQALRAMAMPIPMRVYTSDEQLIAEFGELRRSPVLLNQVPPMLVKAILAIEDQRFYEHPGVDLVGLGRAGAELAMTGTKSQGGSTITMQVARNFYLTRKKTFIRKITEILLAFKIEREFSKNEILELYLNKIYLGNRAYGVAAAAHVYFGKTLNQLTLPEMAMIAGLPKAPSTINPLINPVASKDRRDRVLERMYELGEIDKKTYQAAIATPLTASYHGPVIQVHAPYVAEMVRNMLVTSFGDEAYTKGFNVYTTISSKLQLAANQSLRDALIAYDHRHGYRGAEGNLGAATSDIANTQAWSEALERRLTINDLKPAVITSISGNTISAMLSNGEFITIPPEGLEWAKPQLSPYAGSTSKKANVLKPGDIIRVQATENNSWELTQVPKVQGAFVSLNPNNGAILALIGGFDFQKSKYNRVIQSMRQPGSGFKPFIYSAGLARGFTLASIFDDAPISFAIPGQAVWRPQNDDHKFNGPTRLRVALATSRNVVSVRLLQAIGVPFALNFVSRFGFDSKSLPRNYSLALGTGEVTPLELVRGYSVIANGGFRVTPYVVDHITDSNKMIVYQSAPKVACTNCVVNDTAPPTPLDKTGNAYAPEAIPPQIAFLITSALQDVIHYGTGKGAKVLNRDDIAGKTGTTQEQVDAWFNGFNSDIVATAWVGFDTPAPLHEYGAQAALPMWINFMRIALAGIPEHTMPEPPGITSSRIDPFTGFRRNHGALEYFRSDEVPKVTEPETDDNQTDMTTEEAYKTQMDQIKKQNENPDYSIDQNPDDNNPDTNSNSNETPLTNDSDTDASWGIQDANY